MLALALELSQAGTAYALMTIVRAVRPTSAKPGDKAILTERGEWFGWIGGSCAEPAARRAAREALQDGQCRLLHLTNDETGFDRSGVEVRAMSCYSGGTLEIYVEPHLPRDQLVVFGHSPIAAALVDLGRFMQHEVLHVDLRENAAAALGALAPPRKGAAIVIASHGHAEDDALAWALQKDVAYVGLVASERRLPDVRARLMGRGVGAALERLHAPAGLRIGARSPEEVALSVMSEIVGARRGAASEPVASRAPAGARSQAPGGAPAPSCCDEEPARAVRADPRPTEPVAAAVSPPRSCCDVEPARPVTAPSATAQPSCCSAEPGVTASASSAGDVRVAPSARSSSGGAASTAAPTFSAVVLAAGLSRRMGAPNKLLLPIAGKPMIRHVVETVLAAGFVEVVVVLGHEARAVAEVLESLPVRSAYNEAFESGQVSSVRVGLAALRAPVDGVMVCLGDQPWLEPDDLRALQRAFAARPEGAIVVPMRGERRGNPVLLDRASVEETLARGTNFGCRHYMDEHPGRVYAWQSPNDNFLRDVDEPGDYRAIAGRAP